MAADNGTWVNLTAKTTGVSNVAFAPWLHFLFIFGGVVNPVTPNVTAEVWRYDTRLDVWEQMTSMPAALQLQTAVTVGNTIYLIGGVDNASNEQNVVWRYDCQTDTWTTGFSNLPAARRGMKGVYYNDLIYVVGGWESGAVDKVESYDPWNDAGGWTTRDPLTDERYHHPTCVYDGKIYAVSGQVITGTVTTAEKYTPDSWVSATNTAGVGAQMVTDERTGHIHMTGGSTPSGATGHRRFDEAGGWDTTFPAMNIARADHALVIIDGYLYAACGQNTGGYLNSIERYESDTAGAYSEGWGIHA